jgi:hypothetical protein
LYSVFSGKQAFLREYLTILKVFMPFSGSTKYSPDLNPDEYLSNDVKSNAVGRRCARDKKELKSNVSAYLRSTQKRPSVIKSFFIERPVRYAAM